VVTPSYNQGEFIEQTIRSVLLQAYPDLDYIVIDGGSSDDSVEIIQKYAPYLSYWVSEPDWGQSYAINKGFERSTGQILCWVGIRRTGSLTGSM
jgi:glycosyltransferase involved in cell wall biosynthesis